MNTQPENTRDIIQLLISRIEDELYPIDREAAFDQSLDSEGEVDVAGLWFLPSQIWKEMDPTAYRCGVNDFADSEAWVEVDGQTFDQREVERVASDFLSELESELEELEKELEDGEAGDETDTDEQERLQQLIAEKRAEIAAIEKDDFFN